MSTVGRDIVAAHRFLREIYSQVRGLLRSLDNQMAKRKWYPTHPKCVSYDMGPTMEEKHAWQATWFLRFYHTGVEGQGPVVGIEIYLDPPIGLDEPVCLLFAARPEASWTHKALWDAWQDTDQLFHSILADEPSKAHTLRAVKRVEFGGCMPQAAEFACAVIPLCELSCETDLESRVVGAITEAGDRLRNQQVLRSKSRSAPASRKGTSQ